MSACRAAVAGLGGLVALSFVACGGKPAPPVPRPAPTLAQEPAQPAQEPAQPAQEPAQPAQELPGKVANVGPQKDAAPSKGIPCASRTDCACTSHYEPKAARNLADAASPKDCIVFCEDHTCKAAQGPM